MIESVKPLHIMEGGVHSLQKPRYNWDFGY